jgi:bacillithiol system protein YtxJ
MDGAVGGPGTPEEGAAAPAEGTLRPLDEAGFRRLLDDGTRFVLYKHSPSCGICIWTREHMQAFTARHPELLVHWMDVIGQRLLAREAARLLDVPHASPQVILVEEGAAVWDASHMGVTADAVERALGRFRED